MIDQVIGWLADQAPDRPRAAGGIVVSMYRTSPKAVLVLVGEDGAPSALVKVARDVTGEPAIRAEHDALRRLAGSGGNWLARHVPAPIACDRVAGRLVLAQSYLDGVPMTFRYYTPGHTRSRARVERDFADAGRWLGRFQEETAAGRGSLDDEAIERFVREPIARYREGIGWSDDEEALFTAVRRRAEALRGTALPLADRHGDFWMGNLMVTRDGLSGVVDWELSGSATLPADDLYKFPTSYSFYLNRPYPGSRRVPGHQGWAEAAAAWRTYGDWVNLAGFGYAFFGAGWFPTLVRSWISERSSALGLSAELHPVLFPVFLARQAVTLADPVFRAGYRSALIGLSRERNRCRLWSSDAVDLEESDVHA